MRSDCAPGRPLLVVSALLLGGVGVAGCAVDTQTASIAVASEASEGSGEVRPLGNAGSDSAASDIASSDAATAYLIALEKAGVPAPQADGTMLQLAKGICEKIAAGTPEQEILTKLQPIAAFTATMTVGQMSPEQIAQLYLDKAKSSYCPL